MIVSEMRGRVNIIDLMDMPFNRLHEFYRYTFLIKEERENERIAEEKAREEKEKKEKERAENRKIKPIQFNNRLSPAAQAKESREIKSQADELKKSEENITTELTTPPRFDMEDLTDLLEEGI